MRLAILLLAALLIAVVIPAAFDRSEHENFGSGARVAETVAHTPNPSPSEHVLELGPDVVRLIASEKPAVRARRAPTRATHEPVGAVADLIRSIFGRFGPATVQKALTVFWCESRFNPAARNGQHVGIAQLSRQYQEGRANRLGFAWSDMTDARSNLLVAADLFAERGWQPWSCA